VAAWSVPVSCGAHAADATAVEKASARTVRVRIGVNLLR
jgi:hypothetical protein